MKHVIFVLTLLLIGALLISASFAFAGRAKKDSNTWEKDPSFVHSQARANMPEAVKKMLADDDPTPVNAITLNGGAPFKNFESLPSPVIKSHVGPFSGPLSGSYNVGSGGAYTKISDAVDALNANGVSGA